MNNKYNNNKNNRDSSNDKIATATVRLVIKTTISIIRTAIINMKHAGGLLMIVVVVVVVVVVVAVAEVVA